MLARAFDDISHAVVNQVNFLSRSCIALALGNLHCQFHWFDVPVELLRVELLLLTVCLCIALLQKAQLDLFVRDLYAFTLSHSCPYV